MGIPYDVAQFFGGTSILITVGVLLDTMRQMESHLMMRHYDGFLKKGRCADGFDCRPEKIAESPLRIRNDD
jgi:preprotein translocase subunit SecY